MRAQLSTNPAVATVQEREPNGSQLDGAGGALQRRREQTRCGDRPHRAQPRSGAADALLQGPRSGGAGRQGRRPRRPGAAAPGASAGGADRCRNPGNPPGRRRAARGRRVLRRRRARLRALGRGVRCLLAGAGGRGGRRHAALPAALRDGQDGGDAGGHLGRRDWPPPRPSARRLLLGVDYLGSLGLGGALGSLLAAPASLDRDGSR